MVSSIIIFLISFPLFHILGLYLFYKHLGIPGLFLFLSLICSIYSGVFMGFTLKEHEEEEKKKKV